MFILNFINRFIYFIRLNFKHFDSKNFINNIYIIDVIFVIYIYWMFFILNNVN